jgi:hypothetical protein
MEAKLFSASRDIFVCRDVCCEEGHTLTYLKYYDTHSTVCFQTSFNNFVVITSLICILGKKKIYIYIYTHGTVKWSISRPGRFTPEERAPGTHWIGGRVDLRAGLHDLEKRKFLTPPGLELRPLGRQPVASRYTDYAIPAPSVFMGNA